MTLDPTPSPRHHRPLHSDLLRAEKPTSQREQDLDREEEALKSSQVILGQQIMEGSLALKLSGLALFLSATSAGLDLGFSLLGVALIKTLTEGWTGGELVPRILAALMYPIGYVFVILGRSELFTEHTTLAVLPVLNGQATVTRLARLWAIVYAGNVTGALLFAALFAHFGPSLHVVTEEVIVTLAHTLVDLHWSTIAVSGLLAGWLMGLLGWLVTASRDTVSQIVLIVLVTGLIGLGHLHHCIMGAAEVMAAVLVSDQITLGDFGHFLLWTTLGNAVGGVLFVALLKYSHISNRVSSPS